MGDQAESSNAAVAQPAGADEPMQVRATVGQTGVLSWLASHVPSPWVWMRVWLPAMPAAGVKSICSAEMNPPAPETLYGATAMTLLPAARRDFTSVNCEVCQPLATVEPATWTPLTNSAYWSSTLAR